MEGLELECKHGLSRKMNCYTCFLDFYYKDKREDRLSWLDTIHEAISELKTRISKLEEYKRLQDDLNISLVDHRKKQIDENRAVSKHLTDLDESNAELNSRQNDVEANLQLMPKNLENTMQVNVDILHQKIKELWIALNDRTIPSQESLLKTTGLTFEEAGDDTVKMNVIIPKDLHKELKQLALDLDTTITSLVIRALKVII